MLPFAVDAFNGCAHRSPSKPLTTDKLYYGQKEIGGLVRSEYTHDTFEWVYYNSTITKPFDAWCTSAGGDLPGVAYMREIHKGDITFQQWIEAVKPQKAILPTLQKLAPQRQKIDMAAVTKAMIEDMRAKVEQVTGGIPPFTYNGGNDPVRFESVAITFVSKLPVSDNEKYQYVNYIKTLTDEFAVELAEREKEKHAVDESNRVRGIMEKINYEEQADYNHKLKIEAVVRAIVRKYFRELLDQPLNYHYT